VRKRLAVSASLVVAVVAIPVTATAAPLHNKGLTINATPNPSFAGDPMLIYGRLNLPSPGGQTIRLFHRVNPAAKFTFARQTTTDAAGFYEFTRADGVVTTNRNWFVRGPGSTHSRTVHERVSALLTLAASTAVGLTNRPITFSGSISPTVVHVGERVVVQTLLGDAGDGWSAIGSGVIGSGSTYTISHRFLQPGDHELRILFGGDARNVASESDPVTISVQQTQNSSFTIASSAPAIDDGNSMMISGVLYAPGSTTAPRTATSVTLWSRQVGHAYQAIESTATGADGSYSFTAMPVHNTTYQVRTTIAPPTQQVTAQLFEGVRDVVSVTASATTAAVGQSVNFGGGVTPDKTGHAIYLEQLGPDGHYHVIKVGLVTASSTYSFPWTFGSPGTKTLRVRIPGGDSNVGGVSPPVTVAVSLPPITSLPPAS
jgi:hypothetical protein